VVPAAIAEPHPALCGPDGPVVRAPATVGAPASVNPPTTTEAKGFSG
jgi:hypothetical protein